MSKIDERSKAIRSASVRNALASSRLEGGRPSKSTIEGLKRYVDGQVTIDDLVADVVRRHARA